MWSDGSGISIVDAASGGYRYSRTSGEETNEARSTRLCRRNCWLGSRRAPGGAGGACRHLSVQADPLGHPLRAGRQLRRHLAPGRRADGSQARPDDRHRQSSRLGRRGRARGRGQRAGRRLHDRDGELHRGLRRADLRRPAADAAGAGAGQHPDHGADPDRDPRGRPLRRHQGAPGRSQGQARHRHHGPFRQRHDQPRRDPAPAAQREHQVQHHSLSRLGAGHQRSAGRHDRLLRRPAHQLDAAHPVGQTAGR